MRMINTLKRDLNYAAARLLKDELANVEKINIKFTSSDFDTLNMVIDTAGTMIQAKDVRRRNVTFRLNSREATADGVVAALGVVVTNGDEEETVVIPMISYIAVYVKGSELPHEIRVHYDKSYPYTYGNDLKDLIAMATAAVRNQHDYLFDALTQINNNASGKSVGDLANNNGIMSHNVSVAMAAINGSNPVVDIWFNNGTSIQVRHKAFLAIGDFGNCESEVFDPEYARQALAMCSEAYGRIEIVDFYDLDDDKFNFRIRVPEEIAVSDQYIIEAIFERVALV